MLKHMSKPMNMQCSRLLSALVWRLTIAAGLLLLPHAAFAESKPYHEKYRPQFHFTAETGWLNDPNGLIYHDGEYHLFFQHRPKPGGSRRETRWGHAVSTDLVRWKELDDAILPDGEHPAFSGSAVVDHDNTAGFQTGDKPPIIAVYTSWGQGQFLSYSNDRGRTWTPHEGNPVLALPNDADRSFPNTARDPKVFWYEPRQRWIMLLYQKVDGQGGFGVHSSTNLKQWTYESHIPGFYVCPDLFQLPVDGDANDKRWVILDWEKYAIGEFNGSGFTSGAPKRKLDYGANYSANQTWGNLPSEDGRRIQIAWMRHAKYPGMPFSQQMTFPRELTLRDSEEGVRLYQWPIREIETLVQSTARRENFSLEPGENPLADETAELLDIELRFRPQEASKVSLTLRGQRILYNAETGVIHCQGNQIQIHQPGETDQEISLRILLDRTSLELFINEGRWTMTQAFVPDDGPIEHVLDAAGGPAQVELLEIRRLGSSWNVAPSSAQRPTVAPNIVLVLCDDLGYGDLSCQGHPLIRTPHLDRLAAEGQRWRSFYASAPMCNPSRVALLTGRMPIRIHQKGLNQWAEMPASEITIAEMLKQRDYATAYIGKWGVTNFSETRGTHPNGEGFDYFYGLVGSNDYPTRKGFQRTYENIKNATSDDFPISLYRQREVIEHPVHQPTLTRRFTDEAVAWIQKQTSEQETASGERGQPFFLYLAHSMPHVPIFCSPEFEGRSRAGLYGDVIEELDASVGRVVDTLKQAGVEQNTLVIFTSDNGPWLTYYDLGGSPGPLRDGKLTCWEGGFRVPAIFWWPGTIRPGVIDGIGVNVDLMATLATLAKADVPQDRTYDSIDLSDALLHGKPSPRRQWWYYGESGNLWAYRRDNFKIVLESWESLGTEKERGWRGFDNRQEHNPPLLFDLHNDIHERHNIAAEHPDTLRKLLQELDNPR